MRSLRPAPHFQANITAQACLALCTAAAGCRGLSFEADVAMPATAVSKCYTKVRRLDCAASVLREYCGGAVGVLRKYYRSTTAVLQHPAAASKCYTKLHQGTPRGGGGVCRARRGAGPTSPPRPRRKCHEQVSS